MLETPISATFPVAYDAVNHELRTVRQYFIVRGIPEDIQWEADIVEGTHIEPGRLLGHIIWASAPAEGLRAPAECEGEVAWINRRIPFEVMHRRSIPLLRLAAGQGHTPEA